MMRLKVAFRNVFRNKGRSALSILMIAGAVAGIVQFRGFARDTMQALERVVIDSQYGHVQVASQAYWDNMPGERKARLLTDHEELARKIAALPGVTRVSGRLGFFGLLSNGETTVSAKVAAFDPAKEKELGASLNTLDGKLLADPDANEMIIGSGMQKQLSVKPGDTLTMLVYTFDGIVNAVDFKVTGIYSAGTEEVDNFVVMMPLKAAQLLADTPKVETLSVRAARIEDTDAVRARVEALLRSTEGTGAPAAAPARLSARTWVELSELFRKVDSFYKTQNAIVEGILMVLVLLGILNTVGMTVYERTGEIGTVRALGETDRDVVLQFTLEGAILGAIGVVLGWALGLIVAVTLSSAGITMDMPGAALPIPVNIVLVPSAFITAGLVTWLTAIAATWYPSIRATRMSIVEALKRNI